MKDHQIVSFKYTKTRNHSGQQPVFFFDENYIEAYDDDNMAGEPRYDIIGDASVAGGLSEITIIGNVENFAGDVRDILYVVYTERRNKNVDGKPIEVIRLISARLANDFERGLYYGKVF